MLKLAIYIRVDERMTVSEEGSQITYNILQNLFSLKTEIESDNVAFSQI